MISNPPIAASALLATAGDQKAEIVNGKVKLMSPTGLRPGRAGGRVYASLLRHEESVGGGFAISDNIGFLVDLPGRQSFSPDAAWYVGPDSGMDFGEGAPAFVAEVRSKRDYGPAADREILAKIADYFAAGAKVVWDVDLLGQDTIRKYVHDHPNEPIIFRAGGTADAEPAVPGWRFSVERLLK